jgi:hypothetical protein
MHAATLDPIEPTGSSRRRSASRTPSAIAAGLSASTRTAASPLASSIDGCEETTHGTPHAIASTIGIPKPSNRDG